MRLNEKSQKDVGAKPALVSTDADIVRRCRLGDSAAWEQVVRDFSRRVYNLAFRFAGRHEAAEDLTQEVFIKVYRTLDQYDPTAGDLPNWFMRLARNHIIDDYRKRQRTPTETGEDIEDHSYHLRADTDSPQRRMERQEKKIQVQKAINKLPPDLRECVILRDIEELSYQEIVDLLHIPEGTVKSRINRGRIELAKVLRRMKVQ
jgi:RNA polymerase sigma-70 factor (ECF subfamily)